ncbi:MAG: hypothetical protein LKJ29_03640 [Lactobacillus sp.]|jgi:hypothetical protein|uniref:ABC transporter permease n=1 Tax=Lacticaseibacillus suilingensis TaxID=2799577 RepID=A0ABW4BDG2_9LACO|nr:hypothetical protein [Lacticaseibacillus suilingensis]MCI1894453.1 hypothetical protein [Lactobacillus sp.]MCI1916911.1 hypothetical protein [Lactobacillus sp.]MCI1941128.1 hypothetical protein [Lactobacillus sp.]MCI1971671.1 hypothetical protein [Lactobacillus sp.]MCI2036721.1 hypothetical protein [Lactobacillus sp.]
MLSQFALDFKRLARSSTTIVGYLAFMLVLLISFFYYINDGDIGAVRQFDNFTQTMTQLDTDITQLRKDKTPSKADAALLANKTKQKAMIDDVRLAASAEQGTAGMAVTNPDPLNRTVLKLARYQLTETEAGRGEQLVLFKIEGESFDASVLGRKETVLLYETLLKQHRHQQYFNAPRLPAASYLTAEMRSGRTVLLLLAVLVVLLAEGFALDRRQHTEALRQNLPHGQFSLLLARVAAAGLLGILTLAAAIGSVYLLIGWHDGWGSWTYPLVYAPASTTAATVTIGQYGLQWSGMFLLGAFVLAAVTALVDLCTRSTGATLAIGGALILAANGTFLTAGLVRPLARLLPSAYLRPSPVLLHQASWSLFDVRGGMAVLIGWSVVLLGLCWLKLQSPAPVKTKA